MAVTTPVPAVTANALVDHEAELRLALARVGSARGQGTEFEPAFELPPTSQRLLDYFSVADLGFHELGTLRGRRIVLLDLMRNPRTRTTKTLASLVMVARAAYYTRTTSRPVMILTPSSANKATALRDAVLRGYESGLVTPPQLRIISIVPHGSRAKLWSSALDTDPLLAAANPICVYRGDNPTAVKTIARQAADLCATELRTQRGIDLWYTLDLDNYRPADAMRAVAENALVPTTPGRSRTHVHAVSSAFGLLGHHLGRSVLTAPGVPPGYFLVQHLATPDMVESLYDARVPRYRHDPRTGLYTQQADPRFPLATLDPDEVLDATFYTRSPTTSTDMNAIIGRQGGGGIVVSLYECLASYARIRSLLAGVPVTLPADPRLLREWSLVMAMTGMLNAIDRDLLDADEVILHGSGSYSTDDFTPIPDAFLRPADDAERLREIVRTAAARDVPDDHPMTSTQEK